MLNTTDLFVFAFMLFSFWDGWRTGFLRALLGPLCCFLFSVIAIINFDLNQNIAVALLIVIIGTILFSSSLRLVIISLRSKLDENYRHYVFLGSRLLGAGTSIFWKGFLLMLGILCFSLLPAAPNSLVSKAQNDVLSSQTFLTLHQDILPRYPNVLNGYLTLSFFKNPVSLKSLSEDPEYAAFFEAAKVQAVLDDAPLQTALSSGHYEHVLIDPKIKALITDDVLMKKLMDISRKLYKERMKGRSP